MRRFWAMAVLGSALALLQTGVAWADSAVADGDGGTVLNADPLAFGTVCAGTTTSKDAWFALVRSQGGTNVYKDGSTVTVTAVDPAIPGLSATVPTSPPGANLITIPGPPSPWSAASNGTQSAQVRLRVTLNRSATGPFTGSVTLRATGVNSSNNELVRTADLGVTANVVTCDSTPPTLNLPPDQTVEATGPSGAAVTFTATATDTNPAAPSVSCSPASGTMFPLGTTVVTCSSTDAAGNTATGSFSVTVHDTTAPSFSGVPSGVSAEATAADGATVTYTAPTATDLVDGPRPVGCVPASGATFPLGATTVTCAASDTRGNRAQATFSVTVVDTTRPVLSLPSPLAVEATGPDGAPATFETAAADAVDGTVPVACEPSSGSTFPLGTTTVTCTASDRAGNAVSGSFTVAVGDTTPPVVEVPDSFTVEAAGPDGAPVSFAASASDLVDGDLPASCDVPSGSTLALGSHLVTCSATDGAGNGGTGSFRVTVVDTTGPELFLPADPVVEATGPSGAVVTFAATAWDRVDGSVVVGCAPASGSTFPVGTTLVECTATDAAGNSARGQVAVTVQDTTDPLLSVPADLEVEATGADGAAVAFEATATDLVDAAPAVTCAPAAGTTFPLGETTVTCTATDAAGNEASDSFTVRVVDTTPPVIGSLDDVGAEAASPSGAVVTYSNPGATDLVDGALSTECSPPSGTTFPLGTSPVTCTATDGAGNTGETTFTVLVSDTSGPVLTLPGEITEEATGPAGAVVAFEAAASDAVDGERPVVCSPASGATFPLGATAVGCEASDTRGNHSAGSFSVRVVDTTPPALTVPDDVTAEATGPDGAVVSFEPAAHDAVDGPVPVSCDVPSGSTFPLGTTTVSCTAADTRGHTVTGSFEVAVQDTTAPDVSVPGPLTAEATSAAGAAVAYSATAADLVDGPLTPTCAPAPGSTFPLGTTAVTCTATDRAGHTGSATFTVTVRDTTGPAVSVPAGVVAEATGPDGAPVAFSASALDAVDGALVPTCTPGSGSTFALGSTTVTCTASDAAGNSSSAAFAVSVVDTTAPAISSPTDVRQEAASAGGAVVTYDPPVAEDAVDGTVEAVCAPPSGTVFPLGETTVSCTATDGAGNAASATFTVTVADTSAPTLLVPGAMTVEATGPGGAVVPFSATASDTVDGTVPVTCAPATGSTFPLGTTSVACEARDAAGNATAAGFEVAVVDTTAPVVTVPAAVTTEATGPGGAIVTYATTAHDAVSGALAPSCDRATGSTFPIGTTMVACSATDAAGNSGTASFVVTVLDTTRPVLSLPGDISVQATSASGAPVSFSATAHDTVAGAVPVTCTPPPGSVFAPGTQSVSCSATDGHDNTSTGSFSVTVTFDLGPLLAPVNPTAVNSVKGGSTVPLKWQVPSPSGGYIGSTSIVAGFRQVQVACDTGAVLDDVQMTTTGGTTLRYDTASQQFVQSWQTPKRAGQCYRAEIAFVGGQVLSASFQLR